MPVTGQQARRGQSGVELTHLLARHGATASFRAVLRGRQGVFDAVTAAAAEAGADLLVMGGIGHSPLHKLVFGSATNDLLDGWARLPVLAAG